MTLFEQLCRHADRWLERLDRARDVATQHVHRHGRTPELEAWLDRLERERAKHCELLAHLRALERANHPALLLGSRPRMLKAELRRRTLPRKAAAS